MSRSRSKDSQTGRSHQSWVRWPNTTPMRATWASRCRQGTRPITSQRPPLGTRMPASTLMVVDLPAPLGPMYPTSSPRSMEKETPSRARTSRWRRRSTPRTAPQRPGARSAIWKVLTRLSTRIWGIGGRSVSRPEPLVRIPGSLHPGGPELPLQSPAAVDLQDLPGPAEGGRGDLPERPADGEAAGVGAELDEVLAHPA